MTAKQKALRQLEIPPILKRMGLTRMDLEAMDEDVLRDLVRRVQTLGRRLQSDGPQNDDELHAWVRVNIGVDIPRVAVCEDHDPPFKLLADCYFERIGSVLVLANRGGAKTFIVAVLHFINATYKPGCEGLQFGATEAQGNRCYANIEDWCYTHDKETGRRSEAVKDFILDKPKKSETLWKTGSRVEVVPGSEKAVSGPHPQKAGADEVELMEDGTWNQSRGMAVAKKATGKLPEFMSGFNGMIPPQDVVTSTRNSTRGRMQDLLDEIEQDVREGNIPQFTLIQWCIWETVAEVPNCRAADSKDREQRLKKLGRDPEELCDCNRVVKGRNQDGSRRTLETVCQGKAFRSRGWKPYIDLAQTFKRNTPGTWLLQHECRKGIDENNYIQGWSLDLYGVRNYEPHPNYGPIFQGVDWGAGNPAAVLWFQYLKVEVPAWDFEYQPIWLAADLYVLFDEIYVAGIDSGKLAHRVMAREKEYRNQYGAGWKVQDRFCDPQGRGDRIGWARRGLKSSWPVVTRKKDRMIETVQNIVIDDRFVVDVDKAPSFCEEVEGWQKKPDTDTELDKWNHAMAAWRYGISNAEVRVTSMKQKSGDNQDSGDRGRTRIVTSGRPRKLDLEEDMVKAGPVTLHGASSSPLDQFDMR